MHREAELTQVAARYHELIQPTNDDPYLRLSWAAIESTVREWARLRTRAQRMVGDSRQVDLRRQARELERWLTEDTCFHRYAGIEPDWMAGGLQKLARKITQGESVSFSISHRRAGIKQGNGHLGRKPSRESTVEECAYCRRPMKVYASTPRYYCSMQCYADARRAPYERSSVCRVCGRHLERRNDQALCSQACADALANNSTRLCERCRTPYFPRSAKQRFCSRACGTASRRQGVSGKQIPCRWCKELFTAPHPNSKYCSQDCGRMARKGR
jgi:hypothetical protein